MMSRKVQFSLAGLSTLILIAAIAALVAGQTRVAEHHEMILGHYVPHGLHVDVVELDVDLGIPGITKTYHAVLTNFGPLPIEVTRCEFITDTNSPGSSVAYRLERWDSQSLKWTVVLDEAAGTYCDPYPLSTFAASPANRWLWPGQSLTTEWAAIAAREDLSLGDSVRFVVYTNPRDPESREIITDHFLIDETPTVDVRAPGLKLKH